MAGLVYPSYPSAPNSDGILDAFERSFALARNLRNERDAAEMAPRLLGGIDVGSPNAARQVSLGDIVTGPWGADQTVNGNNPMSLAALGQHVPQAMNAPIQRISPAVNAPSSREAQAMQFFMGKGYSQHQAAGIVGNLIQEGNLNTGALNPGDGADGSDSIGIGQWNGPRAQALRAFAQQNGGDLSDFNTQLDFIEHELGGSEAGVRDRLLQAQNPIQAAAAFVGYERPQGWTADNPYASHGWGNRAKHAARLAGGSYAPQQPQEGAGQALNSLAQGGTQVAQAAGPFPPAPSDSVFDDQDFMRKAFANPLTRDLAINASRARQQSLKDASDPMKRIELQKAELELANLRNPQAKQTDDMREYEFARGQGFKGSFVDFQLAQKKAGATNVTTNVGEGDKFYENLDKKNAETFSALSEEGLRGRSKLSQIDRLEGLLGSSPQGAEGAFKQMLGEWGIDTGDMNNLQAAQALINELVPQQRQPGSGPMSDADLALFKQSLPRIINQPGGNQTIIETMRGITQYQMRMGEIADAVADREMTPKQGREAIRALENPLAQFAKGNGQRSGQSPSGASRGAGSSAGRQRIRNPQTGEVMELRDGQWMPAR